MATPTRKQQVVTILLLCLALAAVVVLGGCSKGPKASQPSAKDISYRTKSQATRTLSFHVAGIHMFPNGSGWAWGSQADRLTLLRTSNKGKSWEVVAIPAPPKLNQSGSVGGVGADFLDSRRGWLAFVAPDTKLIIYRTTNSGKTWQKSSADIKGMSAQVQFVDNRNGWTLVHQEAAMLHEQVSLAHSVNGGATWEIVAAVPPNSPNPPAGSIPFAGEKNGFTFADPNNGFLTAYQPVPGKAFIYASHDAGKTWSLAQLPVAKEYAQVELAAMPPLFFGRTEGILPIVISAQEQQILFYLTHDGGRTWTPNTPLKPVLPQPWVWSFSDAQRGFTTEGKQLYTTADAGKTWTALMLDKQLSGANQVVQLDFVNDRQGWAVDSAGGLFGTVNGGRTWAKVRFVVPNRPVR